MKKIVMIVFAGLLVSAGLQAQKVYIDEDVQGNKRVILDMTAAAGMPAGSTTNESKTALYVDATPTDNDTIVNNTQRGAINATVFQKLEIAPTNLGSMGWIAAFNGCKDPSYNGGGWRLATQRELTMMWIFNDALKIVLLKVGGGALSSSNYRSATESPNVSNACTVSFGNGYTTSSYSKLQSLPVRCVREVN
jgi:hypothetical protein